MKDIYKKALKIAIPMMVQNGISNAVGLVDNLMVGSIGTEAMSAVSIVSQVMFIFYLAIFGAISGPGIYSAQYFGQNNIEGVKHAFRLKIWVCLLVTVVGVLVFIFGEEFIIKLYLKGESEQIDPVLTFDYAGKYLDIMIIGLVPMAITQAYASTLRETGRSVIPMIGGVASVVVDIVLNYVLIFGNFGAPKLGVEGAAIATVVARFVELAIVVIWSHANKKIEFVRGVYRKILVPWSIAGKMLKKGFPVFLNEFLWAGAIAAITQCYSKLGLEYIAGLNIANALINVLNVCFIALGQSSGIIIGQMLGASDFDKAKKYAFPLMFFSAGISALVALILAGTAFVFPNIYNTTQEVKDLGKWFIIITACFFPIQGFVNALYFTVRSGGKTFITFLFDSVFTWVVAYVTAFLLCEFSGLHIFVIYIIIQALDLIKIGVGCILIKKGVWLSNIADGL